MRPTRTQSIKTFLVASTHGDLARLYNHDMEVQVNVAQDGGSRIDGDFKGRQWHGFTDGFQTWKPIRIPYNANSEPEYVDTEITYDLAEHAEGIGMTGWDWASRLSRWVAYDFDAISGHSDRHAKKMTEEELTKLRETVQSIDWVTLRKSTSGRGLHVYVHLDPVPTSNHNEHAALARAILSKMSAAVGFDFSMKVDIAGGNMWVWHRKMIGTDGLILLKSGTVLSEIPANWRDHVKVITGRRRMSLPKFIEDQEAKVPEIEDRFSELCGQRVRVPLDEEHKRLLEWLDHRYPSCSWWDSDNWMLVTHTALLAEAHEELNMRGLFATLATGRDRGSDWNLYAFPMKRGAWAVRRFSPGCQEHPLWAQDGAGWTRCFLNRVPDLRSVCRMFEAQEDSAGWLHFSSAEQAKKAALHLGADLNFPNWALPRKCKLKEHKTGRLVVEMKHETDDPKMEGWLGDKGKWQRLFEVKVSEPLEPEIVVYDDEVRHLITESGEDYGWVVYSDGVWHSEPYQNVKCYLASRGHGGPEVTNILGSSVARHWTLVNMPFEVEYPKDRRWNRGAAQLRFRPTVNRDALKYGSWLSVLRHCGRGLDEAVRANEWCRVNGVLAGADYLKCWVASLFKCPREPLPYLFFYGPQDSGKSIFHEALSLLVVPSAVVVRADTALTSQGNFNGELECAILCVVEETDLQRNKVAYNRIKDWVTSVRLPIHKKQRQPYTVWNTTHWAHCQPADTWVSTSSGPRRVGQLIGVPFHAVVDGFTQPCSELGFRRTGEKEVFEVTTNRGYVTRATSEHPFLVSFDGFEVWLPLAELRPGHELVLSNHRRYEWDGVGSWEHGYVLGYFFGDGSARRSVRETDPVIHIYQDFEVIETITEILDDCNVLDVEDGHTITSRQLKRLLEEYGLEREEISPDFESLSSDFYSGFLRGLFDTDGSCPSYRQRVSLYQSDEKLLRVVQRMLLRLGITSTIYRCREAGTAVSSRGRLVKTKTSFELQIVNRENLVRFMDRIGFSIRRKMESLASIFVGWWKDNSRQRVTAAVSSIRSVGVQPVFDVEVPGAHCYDGDGFELHNCANSHLACPVFAGDTRIVMCAVPELSASEKIPKRDLIASLEAEAPDFLAEILSLELPPSNDRLNVPVVSGEDKALAEKANQTLLEMFLDERTFAVDGKMIAFSDLYDRFTEWLDPNYVKEWSKIRLGREMPPKFPKGRLPATGQFWFGNISWEPYRPGDEVLPRLHVRDGKLLEIRDEHSPTTAQ